MKDFVEPGAVKHGNFINYYDFNSAAERLNLLPTEESLWIPNQLNADEDDVPYLVLDVGCNAGDFTQLLHKFLREKIKKNLIVLGIDIDPILIERANEHNQFEKNVFYNCYDVMDESTDNFIEQHLAKFGKSKFDVVCCFSITMWIHLNNGDDGLKRFLDTVNRLSAILIIEPQPWKCYQNATRRMKRARAQDTFPLFSSLQMRNNIENDIKNYIRDVCRLEIYFESDPTKWKRKICFYK